CHGTRVVTPVDGSRERLLSASSGIGETGVAERGDLEDYGRVIQDRDRTRRSDRGRDVGDGSSRDLTVAVCLFVLNLDADGIAPIIRINVSGGDVAASSNLGNRTNTGRAVAPGDRRRVRIQRAGVRKHGGECDGLSLETGQTGNWPNLWRQVANRQGN